MTRYFIALNLVHENNTMIFYRNNIETISNTLKAVTVLSKFVSHPLKMNTLVSRICALLLPIALSSSLFAQVQPISKWIYHAGPAISFAPRFIANNEAAIGLVAGMERNIYKNLSVGAETGFHYFIGDKTHSTDGKNKAYTIPVFCELKVYFLSQFYAGPRVGAIYFLLNNDARSHVRLAYGLASGFNLPKRNNRINLQAAYTGFAYGTHRGYASVAAGIIIN